MQFVVFRLYCICSMPSPEVQLVMFVSVDGKTLAPIIWVEFRIEINFGLQKPACLVGTELAIGSQYEISQNYIITKTNLSLKAFFLPELSLTLQIIFEREFKFNQIKFYQIFIFHQMIREEGCQKCCQFIS